MRAIKLFFVMTIILFVSCAGSSKLSINKMLEYSGREQLPEQAEYHEYGAVILYEDIKTRFFLDINWELQRSQTYHLAFRYFNDKAKNWLTRTIYLYDDRILLNFYARTIKPDGSALELSKKDLFPTQVKDNYSDFTKNQSRKFTFSGVEPGAVLEYLYEIEIRDKFSLNDHWYIQSSLPKLYTRYSMQIPIILFENNISWDYSPVNLSMDQPQIMKDIVSQDSDKNRNNTYFWEIRNVPSLNCESNMPAYDDVAQYAILGIPRKNWNELSEIYWATVKDRFSQENLPEIKTLAASIAGSAEDDSSKIQKIFFYTQRNYRYVAIDIGDSGYIPNFPMEIIKRKYGDCKDMTLMNVVLLKSLGIEAYPALVKTKDAGSFQPGIIQMDFNHMIAYVKDKDGREYWLDATGSKSQENRMIRTITLNLAYNGSVQGHVKLEMEGNENLSFRSALKDATEKDMFRIIESYVNLNTPDIQISNLKYDDPGNIVDKIKIEFDFNHQSYGSVTTDLAIVNPYIFSLENNLDRFRDEKRKCPLIFQAPYEVIDKVNINFKKDMFCFESTDASFSKNYNFGSLYIKNNRNGEENIYFERKYKLSETRVASKYYKDYRDFLKNINKSNRLNLVLKKLKL